MPANLKLSPPSTGVKVTFPSLNLATNEVTLDSSPKRTHASVVPTVYSTNFTSTIVFKKVFRAKESVLVGTLNYESTLVMNCRALI